MRKYGAGFVLSMAVMTAAAAPAQETDRTRVFYNMANSLGMLRTVREVDSVMTLEVWGRGTVRDVAANGTIGPEVPIKSLYAQIAYDFPGMRVEIVRATGERTIEVISGAHAWNEIDKLGGGLEPGYGSAMPAMDQVTTRLLRMWMTPFGAVKAARAAGDQATVTIEGGRTAVTFPLADGKPDQTVYMMVGELRGTPMKVTLDDRYRPAKVEVTFRGHTYVNTYSSYGDLNEADLKADIFVPARFVATVDGQVVLDLTVDRTNTYNPYVIMPVPPAVQNAGAR
jgi:hypothetical protein